MTHPFEVQLHLSVPERLRGDVLAKMHYVSESLESFDFAPGRFDCLQFSLKAGHASETPTVKARIREVAETMCKSHKTFEPRVLGSRACTGTFTQDPHPLLESSGQLIAFGRGRYGLGPRLSRLIQMFEERFRQMAAEFNAPEHTFPSLIGAETMERCGYLASFPHLLSLVSHLREDLPSIQDFASGARWNGTALDYDPASLASAKCLLSPAVCFHWYAWLAGQQLTEARSISALGKCFRYESGSLSGLERLWDYTVREIIFMGGKDHVLERRQRAIDLTQTLLERIELGFEIVSASDPFFVGDFASGSDFQLTFDVKFEVRARLPYRSSTLAVGSFNYHRDFFGRSFNIQNSEGAAAHTACAAFGLERLALAFLAQHGLEPKRWPEAMRGNFR